MTVEEQRKLLGADGDIEKDCDRIAQEAARQVLDMTSFTSSIANMLGAIEELDPVDVENKEIANAIDLERDVEQTGEPRKMCELAEWMERYEGLAEDEEDWACAMLKWYAKAALAGAPAAISSIGRAFRGSFDDASIFASPDEDIDTNEDDCLLQDPIIAATCELSAAKRGDSYGMLKWYHYYMGWHDEKVCERNFDKAMEYLIQLVERSYEVNKGTMRDQWAFQGPYQLELLVKKAPPQKDAAWNDYEYPYIFGLCHEHGWVLKKDINKALDYYRMGAGFGHEKSISAVKRLEVKG